MNPFTTHGAPSWAELLTTNPTEAAAFYQRLFGWNHTVLDMAAMGMEEGKYHMMKAGDINAAGIMDLPEENIPPSWCYYITTENVNLVVAKATESGATIVVPTTEIPGLGKFCGFLDPQGAYLAAIEYAPTGGTGGPQNLEEAFVTHGMFSWPQLQTSDMEAAMKFYTDLFGWTIIKEEMGTGPYHVIKVGNDSIGGIIPSPHPEVPPHWSNYVTVNDADAILEAVQENGGTVTVPAFDIPDVGRLAHFMDPQGAHLAIIAYEMPNT